MYKLDWVCVLQWRLTGLNAWNFICTAEVTNTQGHMARLSLSICNLHDTAAAVVSLLVPAVRRQLMFFGVTVLSADTCWKVMNSRFSVRFKWTHIKDQYVNHDSSVGILNYWLADRGNVVWFQHWQGICTYTKPPKPFLVKQTGLYSGVSYPG